MSKKPNIKAIAKGLIILACFGLIVYYFKTHTEEINQINKISLGDVGLLAFSLFFGQVIHCYKLYLLVDPLGLKGVNFLEWFRIITVSRFVNQHIIQGAAIYRFIKLKKDYQFSYSNSFGLTVYYVWLETVSLLAITVLILSILMFLQTFDLIKTVFYLAVLLGFLLIAPFILFYFYQRIKFLKNNKFDKDISQMCEAIFSHLKKPKFLIQYFLTTFLFIFVYMAAVHIGFRSVDIPLTFYQNLLYTMVLILTRMFNVVPANIGISELICGSISQAVQVSFGSGIIISGMVRIINYTIYGLVTLVSFVVSLISPERKNS